MDPDTLSQTATIYALSTLAQVCASLVVFLGAVALYRLGVFEDIGREIRDLDEDAVTFGGPRSFF